ncbi:hypothetical protein IHE48_39095 [Frankia sp. CH37]|nr:hypothetical protein [Parafrankia sp. CH37]MBE3206833.1 hypothetical protein [Parafrankia sp. CH37]
MQSTTLALLAAEGTLPKPDAAIFADTGWEPARVYRHLDRLEGELTGAGIPLYRVSNGNLREHTLTSPSGRIRLPVFTATAAGGGAPAVRECTREHKIRPITRKVRELIGYPGRARVPGDVWVEQWIGFSTDEIQRVSGKSDAPYITSRYPLLDLDMSRRDCVRWLTARGWADTPKSACIGCPFHGNRAWREMRDQHPDEFADAVEVDRAMRARTVRVGLRGEPYLHRSLLPLDQAPIDHVTRTEWRDRQGDLLDELAEDGDPDGCSPYGCRSGQAA